MENVTKIDIAMCETMDKYKDNHNYNITHFIHALENGLIYNNFRGFTTQNSARYFIEDLSKDELICELLKNVVKKHAVDDEEGNYESLSTPKEYKDEMHPKEKEKWIYNSLKNVPLDFISALTKREIEKLQQNPTSASIIHFLVSEFVSTRYFDDNYGIYNLENDMIISNEQETLDKIDAFYKSKKKGL